MIRAILVLALLFFLASLVDIGPEPWEYRAMIEQRYAASGPEEPAA